LGKGKLVVTANKSALILFSKGFARHIRSRKSTFLNAIVNKLFQEQDFPQLRATFAVVDRIPTQPNQLAKGLAGLEDAGVPDDDAGLEGISFIVADDHELNLIPIKESPDASHTRYIAISTKTGLEASLSTVKLPVANTLFENERPNTFIHSIWNRSHGSLEMVDGADITSVSVDFPETEDTRQLVSALTIPYSELTATRKIEEGLGNVIRSISDPTSQRVMPASAELQRELTTGVAHKGQIFSIVMPPELYHSIKSKIRSIIATDDIEINDSHHMMEMEMESMIIFDDLLAHIQHGACVRRVVGGGGEWGDRASLVTLEPTGPFDMNTSLESDEDISMSYIQRLNSASIAPAGHYIQFYIADLDRGLLSDSPDTPLLKLGCISGDSMIQLPDQAIHSFTYGTFGGLSSLAIGIDIPLSMTSNEALTRRVQSTHVDIHGTIFTLRLPTHSRNGEESSILSSDPPISLRDHTVQQATQKLDENALRSGSSSPQSEKHKVYQTQTNRLIKKVVKDFRATARKLAMENDIKGLRALGINALDIELRAKQREETRNWMFGQRDATEQNSRPMTKATGTAATPIPTDQGVLAVSDYNTRHAIKNQRVRELAMERSKTPQEKFPRLLNIGLQSRKERHLKDPVAFRKTILPRKSRHSELRLVLREVSHADYRQILNECLSTRRELLDTVHAVWNVSQEIFNRRNNPKLRAILDQLDSDEESPSVFDLSQEVREGHQSDDPISRLPKIARAARGGRSEIGDRPKGREIAFNTL